MKERGFVYSGAGKRISVTGIDLASGEDSTIERIIIQPPYNDFNERITMMRSMMAERMQVPSEMLFPQEKDSKIIKCTKCGKGNVTLNKLSNGKYACKDCRGTWGEGGYLV